MNKAELVAELAPKIGTSRRVALAAVDGLVDIIVRTLEKGDSVTISGFGVFEQKERAARVARNPRTGQALTVEATSVPAFRPGHNFKAIIDGSAPIPEDGFAVRRHIATELTKVKAPAVKKESKKKNSHKVEKSSSTKVAKASAKTKSDKSTDKPKKKKKK